MRAEGRGLGSGDHCVEGECSDHNIEYGCGAILPVERDGYHCDAPTGSGDAMRVSYPCGWATPVGD